MGSPDPQQDAQAPEPGVLGPAPQDPEGSVGKESGIANWRRYMILFIVSWNCLVIVATSTSVLVAAPEVSKDFHTTPTIINITNSGVLLAMGISSMVWVPLGDWFTRRISYSAATAVMFISSIGTAVAHNFATFTATRLLTGLTGTYFMVAGQTIIADCFGPLVRGRAVGCMMVGSVAGGALGMFDPYDPSAAPLIDNLRAMHRRYHSDLQPLEIYLLAPGRSVRPRVCPGPGLHSRHPLQRQSTAIFASASFYYPCQATGVPRGPHLRVPRLNSICTGLVREAHHQPALQPHHPAGRWVVLLGPCCRICCW